MPCPTCGSQTSIDRARESLKKAVAAYIEAKWPRAPDGTVDTIFGEIIAEVQKAEPIFRADSKG